MTAAEIARLKEIAGKETAGPWFVHDFADPLVSANPGPQDVTVSCATPDHLTVANMGNAVTASLDEARANAAHIAAFDPPTVLALLAALEQSQAALAEAKWAKSKLIELRDERDALRARLEAAEGALKAHDELCAQLPDSSVKRLSKSQRRKLLTPELLRVVIGLDDETLAALHDHLHELMTLRSERRARAAIAEMEK